MKDKFVLAILASIAMHLLLIEMVITLELLWPPARQAGERHVIPVALLEVDRPANPTGSSPLDRARPEKNVRPGPVNPHKELAKLKASPGRSAVPAAKIPRLAEVTNFAEPTARPLPKAEKRQEAEAAPAVATAVAPAATPPPAGLASPQDASLCTTAEVAEKVNFGGWGAEKGSSGGAAAYRGHDDDGAGQGAILVPDEFLVGNPPPRYPQIARRKGWEGTVVIDIRVSSGGWVQEARIDKSSGYTVLDDAALGAVRNWRIALQGRLVDSSFKFRVPVIFKLTLS